MNRVEALTTVPVYDHLRTVDETMDLGDLMLCSVHASIFLACFYSLTFLLSALGNEPMKIAFVMMFLSIFQFAIYMVKTITHYSIFRMADVETFVEVRRAGLDWPLLAGLLAFSTACYVGALAIFARRVP